MSTLLERLSELTADLTPAAGTADSVLADVRRNIAASLILDDADLASTNGQPDTGDDADLAIQEAADQGEKLAAELTAKSARLRVVKEPYLAVEAYGEKPIAVEGPLVDGDFGLVQHASYDRIPFFSVAADVKDATGVRIVVVALLPRGTKRDPNDATRWNVPPGSAWLRAETLVPGATGWAGIRVAGGTLQAGVQPDGSSGVIVLRNTPWTLTVAPEAPPAAAGGNDGDAVALTLPTELQVRGGLPPIVKGPLAMTGFGSLRFTAQTGSPFVDLDGIEKAIHFPFDIGTAKWSINSNRSRLFKVQTDQALAVTRAAWALPLASVSRFDLGETRHGGSLAVLLPAGVRSQIIGTTSSSRWDRTTLTANARGIELRGERALADITFDVALWGPARSTVSVSRAPGVTVRHASRRGGGDIATISSGRVINRWDLPRAASGEPFEFDGHVQSLTFVVERDGRRRTALQATRPADHVNVYGYALENLYLHVHGARRMAFVGSGNANVPTRLTEGQARLLFDVRLAQATAPQPYANNWDVSSLNTTVVESALSAAVTWAPAAAPTLKSSLRNPVSMPPLGFRGPVPGIGPAPGMRQPRGLDNELVDQYLLLDVSGRADQLGVAFGPPALDEVLTINDNVLQRELRGTKSLMGPQVLWEPVQVVANPNVGATNERVASLTHGGYTLAGLWSPEQVPVISSDVAAQVVAGANSRYGWDATFGLPFGLVAQASIPDDPEDTNPPPQIDVTLHTPVFSRTDGVFVGARQLRLAATGYGLPQGDPSRTMTGSLTQTPNLAPNGNNLADVLGSVVTYAVNEKFKDRLPLHNADLSGYGLSTFSHWREAAPDVGEELTGITQVRFDVVVGRTSYEVIQLASRLWHPQARVVRTIILDRANSGTVYRYDSGWVAIEDGACKRYAKIETGVVSRYRNIRNIRILPKPLVQVVDWTGRVWHWQEVVYDADLHLVPDPQGQPEGQTVPIREHIGYVQVAPMDAVPKESDCSSLMGAIGGRIGGPLDVRVRLGGTLSMQLSHLTVALSSNKGMPKPAFVLAVSGAPTLPRAGQWTAVAIDGPTQDVSPVDPRLGLPVIRRDAENTFVFRDAQDAYAAFSTEYGLLVSTPSTRVLFPKPRVDSTTPGRLTTSPPQIADPSALAQASGMFPRLPFTLTCLEDAPFTVSNSNEWKLDLQRFNFSANPAAVGVGSGWTINRQFPTGPRLADVVVDSVNAVPWQVGLKQPDELTLRIDPFGEVVTIKSLFKAASRAVPGFDKPTVKLGTALRQLEELVNVLKFFTNLGFKIDVDVSAGNGPTPSFVVRLGMRLRIPAKTGERVDIGVGKLLGKFEVTGQLQAAPSGTATGQLAVELSGDVQQAIIPPVLYAGGQFRFVAQITDSGKPVIEMGFGTAASVGGALIKGLLELEATVRYGYTLIPETLQPGVMLGIEARAKLLAGLLGLSFSADAMARIQHLTPNDITIWAEIRVAATIQIAVLIEEEVDFRTQFKQTIPASAFVLAAGAAMPLVAATEAIRQA